MRDTSLATVKQTAQQVLDSLRIDGLVAVVLGAFARDEATETSDLDLILFATKEVDMNKVARFLAALPYEIDLRFSPSVVTSAEELRDWYKTSDVWTKTALVYADILAGDKDAYKRFLGVRYDVLSTPPTPSELHTYTGNIRQMRGIGTRKARTIDACEKALQYWINFSKR